MSILQTHTWWHVDENEHYKHIDGKELESDFLWLRLVVWRKGRNQAACSTLNVIATDNKKGSIPLG